MRRFSAWLFVVLVSGWLLWSLATVPPAAKTLDLPGPAVPPQVRGAYHIHSTASDGTGTVADIARSARRAGLDFIIVTDHADGTRVLPPPRYEAGVLTLEAMEISTDDGHYAALGLDTPPYRLGGDGRDVAEDVMRLGGFGIVAHPDSAKPDLRWRDWNMPIGGYEWFNADSQWRDESRLALVPVLLHYLLRKPEAVASLFDRPADALAQWDRLAARGHVVGMAAADAHARLGLRGRSDPYVDALYVRLPSYESVFRAFSLRVDLDEPFEGDALRDGRRLLNALRLGRVTTTFEALASPARVVFEGEAAGERVGPGGDLSHVTPITFRVRSNAPAGATIILMRNGESVHESATPEVEWLTDRAGAFRAEIRLPDALGQPPIPWVVTNPIYVAVPPGPPRPTPLAAARSSTVIPRGTWNIERDPASQGVIHLLSPEGAPIFASFSYRLAPRPAASPYVAAVTHDVGPLFEADRLAFQASATKPMRLSVQLRSQAGGVERRWRRSVYLDETAREVTIAFAEMRGVAEARGMPLRIRDMSALLFVVDTVNTAPGDQGAVTLVNLRAEK
ncbi:MAG: hypothetical protein AB1806_10945 [Acidobacteriota bacterium]